MPKKDAVMAVYHAYADAEAAVKELQAAGFGLKKLSMVGRDHREHGPARFQRAPAKVMSWTACDQRRPRGREVNIRLMDVRA